jgi:SAM-dependent methyltransferase
LTHHASIMNGSTDRNESRHWDASDASAKVVEYFSQRASEYQTKSSRLPWAWVRALELAAIHRLLGDVEGCEVLELGAGAGFYTRDLVRRGARHVWAVDMSDAMLAMLPSGPITPILGDAETIRLSRRFKLLISTGMLEFVRDPSAALANAAYHAEPGARFVLLAPRASILGRLYRRFHAAHGLRIHLFDRSWFETAAPRTGWLVRSVVRVPLFSLAVRLVRAE